MGGRDLINALSSELLIEIMKRLGEESPERNACAQVCKRWHVLDRESRKAISIRARMTAPEHIYRFRKVISQLPQLVSVCISGDGSWNSPSTKRKRTMAPLDEQLEMLEALQECASLFNLGYTSLQDMALHLLGQICPRLESVTLNRCLSVTRNGLLSLTHSCKHLKKLHFKSGAITDHILSGLAIACHAIEDLELDHCEDATDLGLVAIVVGCGKTLRALSVIGGFAMDNGTAWEAIGTSCPVLESLFVSTRFIPDDGVRSVVTGCVKLKALHLICTWDLDDAIYEGLDIEPNIARRSLTDGGLRAIGSHCGDLESLTLSGHYLLTDQGLEAVAAGCRNLLFLEITICNAKNRAYRRVGQPAIHLHELCLAHCRRITSIGLMHIANACLQLRSVHLEMCEGVESLGVECIALNAKHLRRLEIIECTQVTDDALLAVGKYCKELTSLKLNLFLNDWGIFAVAYGCKSLERLVFGNRCLLSDRGISAIGRNLRRLVYLDVNHGRFSDAGLYALVRRGSQLREVILHNCPNISASGIRAVERNCRDLELLSWGHIRWLFNPPRLEWIAVP